MAFRVPLTSYNATSLAEFFESLKAKASLCTKEWSPPCPRGGVEVPAGLRTGEVVGWLRREGGGEGKRRRLEGKWGEWDALVVAHGEGGEGGEGGDDNVIVRAAGEHCVVAVTRRFIIRVGDEGRSATMISEVSEVRGGGSKLDVVLSGGVEETVLFDGGVDQASLANLMSVLATLLPPLTPVVSPRREQREEEGGRPLDAGQGGGEGVAEGHGVEGGGGEGSRGGGAGGRLGYAVIAGGEDASELLATAVGHVCACGVTSRALYLACSGDILPQKGKMVPLETIGGVNSTDDHKIQVFAREGSIAMDNDAVDGRRGGEGGMKEGRGVLLELKVGGGCT